jgi:translation elongation factor EF-G
LIVNIVNKHQEIVFRTASVKDQIEHEKSAVIAMVKKLDEMGRELESILDQAKEAVNGPYGLFSFTKMVWIAKIY